MDSGNFSGFGFFWILVVVDLAVVTQTTSLRKPGEDRGPLGLRRVCWIKSQKVGVLGGKWVDLEKRGVFSGF